MLVVTAYYNIPSKKPSSFYYEHITRFFRFVKVQVLFFTDEENHNKLKDIAGDNITFYIQPFENMGIFNEFPIDFWKYQITKDPEKYHTWQVGALWANKSGFVKQAAELYPIHDWYMWVDCGSLRTDDWEPQLHDFGKRALPESSGVYLQVIRTMPAKRQLFGFRTESDCDYHIAGSHILFNKEYINRFIQSFYTIIREYSTCGKSLISDQNIMNTMSYDNHFMKLIPNNVNCPDGWFFFFCVF